VVRPEAYSESTAWIATYMAGVLNVSNIICKNKPLLSKGPKGIKISPWPLLNDAKSIEIWTYHNNEKCVTTVLPWTFQRNLW